ncbi:helix-turn-helix domain-containing protein [Nonomuraea sp. NPDC059007]|uniref:helix-turn-helix domain-containing protein n=1 Tax=Nonomuraea sp. NPDC059007 TaxID=3346692 RepID=UPI0036AA4974
MSTLIRTEQVPPADRLQFTQDLTASTWVPMDCRSEHHRDYLGVLRVNGLGAMTVVAMDILPITVRRTPKLIEQADPDLMKLLLVRANGSSVVEQDGRQALLGPAGFAFYDTRRPYEVSCGVGVHEPTRVLTFAFPPSLLPLSRRQLRHLTATCFPATAGVGALTSQFLMQLARDIDHFSPAEAARLSATALEVLAVRLARELGADRWPTPEARRHALLTTIQAFILQHLGASWLSPATIAAAHHISLRSLHQLFHDQGLTAAAWIRQRRLERCRRDLADPALAGRPVAVIAARWGFASASDFSRTFRAAHGLPPGQYRLAQARHLVLQ